MNAFEDSFVERKTASDSSDWLDAAVAFANTTPIGYPAILFIGVRDDGTVEGTPNNLDSLQKTLSKRLAKAYPPLYFLTRVLQREGKKFLAVIVPGSESRPHFAGPAFLRDGSKTVVASNEQFDKLISERDNKAYWILKWKGKTVTLKRPEGEELYAGTTRPRAAVSIAVTVVECNQFYVTLRSIKQINLFVSYPLNIIDLNFDHAERQLELHLLQGRLPC